MKLPIRILLALAAACALAACVSSDGTPERKQEDPSQKAAKANVQLGTAYLQEGNYPVAKEKLERALKQNPRDPDVHTSLALLYDNTGDPKGADRHFREALRLAPERPDLSNNYGVYLCKNGRVDEGVERLSTVAANKSYRTPEVALTNAGVCLFDAKRFEEARAKFAGAIRAKPNYSEATVQLATVHLALGQIPEARKAVDTYLGAFRPSPDVLYAAVTVARAAKDKITEDKYTRRLRLDFPESVQARALARQQP
jgi:type IV pilus assembly protein PilF